MGDCTSFGSLMIVLGRKDLRVKTRVPSAEAATLTVRTSLTNTAGSNTKNFQITCPALGQTSSYKCPTQGQQAVDASLQLDASSCPFSSLAGEGKKRGDSKWVSDKCLYDG